MVIIVGNIMVVLIAVARVKARVKARGAWDTVRQEGPDPAG